MNNNDGYDDIVGNDDKDKDKNIYGGYQHLSKEEIAKLPKYKNGKIKGYTMKGVDALVIRKRAYDLYLEGHLSMEINKILQAEFGLKDKSVWNYIREVRQDFIRNHEEEFHDLRIRLISMLWNDIRTRTNYWERSDAIKNLMKITGLGSENINVKTEQVINTYEIITKKDDENGGNK